MNDRKRIIIEEYNKRMTPEKWIKAYKDEIDIEHFTKDEGHSPLADELIKDLKKIGIQSADILEIGCGVGRDSIYLAGEGHRVRSIDISKKAIQIASNHAKNLSVKFEVGNAENLYQFGNNSQDAVYSIAALHSTPIKFTFEEIFRVLKPKGIAKLFLYTRTKTGDRWVSYWTPGEIKYYSKEAGFKIKKFRECNDTHPIKIRGVSGKINQETHIVITTLKKPANIKRFYSNIN
jgi:ubiquinone/menaquinone biosynthesis C-methylase UbiE